MLCDGEFLLWLGNKAYLNELSASVYLRIVCDLKICEDLN
jgi:hypothetical protein